MAEGETRNEAKDVSGNVVQGRDFHGDIHFGGRPRGWLWPAVFLAVCVLVAGAVFLWPEKEGAGLRVSVVPVRELPPWEFASSSPDYPGAALAAKLARPYSVKDLGLQGELRAAGGLPVEHQTVRLHLVGPDDGAVRVVDIRPVIRGTGAPVDGVLVYGRGQGAETSSSLHLYLDDDVPVVQGTTEDDMGRRVPAGPFFPGTTINLANGETHEVVMTTFAHDKSYEYVLEVEYQAGTETRRLTVDDGGKPLRVTGLSCAAPGLASYGRVYDLVGADMSVEPLAEGASQKEDRC
ncbi:hypothetical protein [Actinophytocola sp. KF-1]